MYLKIIIWLVLWRPDMQDRPEKVLSQLTSLRMFFKSTSQYLLNIYIREFQKIIQSWCWTSLTWTRVIDWVWPAILNLARHSAAKASRLMAALMQKTVWVRVCVCVCVSVCLGEKACERVRIMVKCFKCSERITFCFYYGLTNNQSQKSVTQLAILIPVVYERLILVACSLQEDPIGSFLPLY